MPGKIFINETADKQKVELTTGADGVTGGYYDASGEWHEFGGGGGASLYSVTLKLSNDSTIGLNVHKLEDTGDFIVSYLSDLQIPGDSIDSLAFDNYLLASTSTGGYVLELISGNAEIMEVPDMELYALIVKGSGEIVVRHTSE